MNNTNSTCSAPVCMIAHRGFSGKYPENTELAFIKAGENRSGGAETDIRVTKDGVLVCSHNGDVVFNDGTTLTVEASTFVQLTEKPLKNVKTDDQVFICAFKRYLEIMKQFDMICFIELKGVFSDSQEKQVMDCIEKEYDISKCILQSFQFDNLVRIHKFYPALPLMFTYGSAQSEYERCFEYGFSIDADQYVVTEKMINDFHAQGLKVGVWTCNTEESVEKCKVLGVDYIESDVFGGLN